MKLGSAALLAAAACLGLASPALARHVHYRGSHPDREVGVMRDVLLANPYGDVIIDGGSGFHRSDAGVMVPDSEPPSFVAVGRASRSDLGGASGLPGYDTH